MKRIVGLAVVLAFGQMAQAQVTTYSDRVAWNSAASGFIQTEDFNSFVTDTSFQGAAVPLLNMSITHLNGTSDPTKNFIDVFPFAENGKRSFDNTPYVLGEVNDRGAIIRIDFRSPITGWGANFVSHDASAVIDVFDRFNNYIGTTAPIATETTFYGFHLSAGQSAGRIELKFIGIFNDLFGMDNLSFLNSSAPPDPAALTASLVASVNAITTLNEGQTMSLTQKLRAVLELISKGQTRAAINTLNAFVLQVQALVSNGSLTSSVGQALIADAAVIAALLA